LKDGSFAFLCGFATHKLGKRKNSMSANKSLFISQSANKRISQLSIQVFTKEKKHIHQRRNSTTIETTYSISPKCEIISPTIWMHLCLTTLFFAKKPFNNQVNNLTTKRVVEFSSSSLFLLDDDDDEAALLFASITTPSQNQIKSAKSERFRKAQLTFLIH
jgi:hypothetical protein